MNAPSSPWGRPTRPTKTHAPSSLVDNLEQDALAALRTARADECPQGSRDAALAADHLADIVLGHAQLEHDGVVTLGPAHLDLVRMRDELPGDVLEQLFHGATGRSSP